MAQVPIPDGGYKVDSVRANAQKKGGRVDLASLLAHTSAHPKGRVMIDPATGLVRNPKNNVLYSKKIKVKADGTVIGVRDIGINGGHVKKEGSVWRIALGGPAKYHFKVITDDYRFAVQQKGDRTAPELTIEEMEEYQFFRVFLKETNTKVNEGNFDLVNEKFYEWLSKKDTSKIEIMPMGIYHPNAPTNAPVS